MTDDQTRRLLYDADPARTLPPADAAALASLLEDTMSQPQTDPIAAVRRRPSRLALVSGVAAASVAAAIGIVVSVNGSDSPTRTPDTTTAAPSVTRLALSAGGAAKCMAPSAAFVGKQPLAFEGTVTSIKDGIVTLDPSHFYKGTATDLVTVTEADPGNSESVDFQVGDAYIVGATDGTVGICSSGRASDDLRAAYVEAFGN